jgi:hypothetical protein
VELGVGKVRKDFKSEGSLKLHFKRKYKFHSGKKKGRSFPKTHTLDMSFFECHMIHLGICEHQEKEEKSWGINCQVGSAHRRDILACHVWSTDIQEIQRSHGQFEQKSDRIK